MINPTRRCREVAFQFLYIHEQNDGDSALSAKEFVHRRIGERKHRNRTLLLINTALDHCKKIDEKLAEIILNWNMPRLTTVDRNVLRVGVCELIRSDKTPPKVAVAEAVRLAKRYGTDQSHVFVNGLLSQFYATFVQGHPKPLGVHGQVDANNDAKLDLDSVAPKLEPESAPEPEPEFKSESESSAPELAATTTEDPLPDSDEKPKPKSGLGLRARAVTARMKS